MFKSFTIILLIFSMIGSTLSGYIVLISFELNKRYIAENLCENRAKPELKCNGKCFLKKKLKKTEDSEKNNSQRSEQKNLNFFSIEPPTKLSLEICLFSNAVAKPGTYYNSVYSIANLAAVFRPPQLS